jgi:hypothetical protein
MVCWVLALLLLVLLLVLRFVILCMVILLLRVNVVRHPAPGASTRASPALGSVQEQEHQGRPPAGHGLPHA